MTLENAAAQCRPEICAAIRGLKKFGRVWTLIVVAYLLDGPLRFNELLRVGKGDGLNSRTLSRTLRRLVEQQLVHREVIGTQPFAVRYSLTSRGRRLSHLFEAYEELDEDRVLHRIPA